MQVDPNELKFIQENAPNGLFSMVAANLIKSGFQTTRFIVAKEASSIKPDYREEIITELRRVFELNTGLKFEREVA
jgi:hypothetical protein